MARPARRGGNRGGSGRRSGKGRAARPQAKRHYPRTARLNTLLREIVADYLERLDDDRFGLVTVTGVEVDSDLNKAEVFVSALEQEPDPEADAEFLEALGEYRKPIQAQIARQARLRKTPEVVFAFDPGVRTGARIEEILSNLDLPPDPPIGDGPTSDGEGAAIDGSSDDVTTEEHDG